MSWKKHFKIVAPVNKVTDFNAHLSDQQGGGTSSKYSSYLPEVYAGHPARIQRYYQFEDMDRDSDINAALDTIADFCTQTEEQNDTAFDIRYNEEANETEVKLLKTYLLRWCKLNDFESRLWFIFRNCIKNGDAFFLRDPETMEWLWMDHFNVELVKVDETQGKKPDEYIVRGMDYNRQMKFATTKADPSQYRTPMGNNLGTNMAARPMIQGTAGSTFQLMGANRDARSMGLNAQQNGTNEAHVIDAKHVVHLSTSVGMDINWPFGTSILEPIYKTFKQKELLEDSIIIYRVQRAPERRIFYIDCGTMPAPKANAHIERIKNEIHQRRIPNRMGGGSNILDAAYSPLCLAMDTQVPLLDGRTLTLSELAVEFEGGRENWIYSCDPVTGAIVPGNVSWAGVTRRDAEVVRITLDNGQSFVCTPDHKIPVLGKGFVEAKDICINEDSLISFEPRQQVKVVLIEYLTDRIVVGTLTIDAEEKWHNHHTFALTCGIFVKNSMLEDYFFAQCLSFSQQIQLLSGKTATLGQLIEDYNCGKTNYVYSLNTKTFQLEPGKIVWAGATRRNAQLVRVTLDNGEHVDSTPDHRFILRDGSEIEAQHLQTGDSLMPLYLLPGRSGTKQKIEKYTRYICNRTGKKKFVHTAVCPKPKGREWVVHHKDFDSTNNRPDNLEVMSRHDHEALHKACGTYSLTKQWNDPEGRANLLTLDKLCQAGGYEDWHDFKQGYASNHKVVSVEWLADREDTGDITIESTSGSHVFALAAGIYVHNSADGRGSKVETLPGGELVGEIGDLIHFQRKLMRGLKIPPSYLPIGTEDDKVAYNDGKLGSAMIQEYKFSNYCKRLQYLLVSKFDTEFKKYLRENGIEIESALFELKFNEPQNFTKYRQIELDMAQMGVFSQVMEYKKMSERFKMKRFLNMDDDEILENEKLWAEENSDRLKRNTGQTPAETELGDIGLSSVGVRGGMDPMPGEEELGDMDDAEPAAGAAPGAAGAPPPPGGTPPL